MTAGSSAAAVAPVAAEAVPVARVARRTAAVEAASQLGAAPFGDGSGRRSLG
jgi:hypothetical protein